MLDKRCLALLNILNSECLSSGYKVITIEELTTSMPAFFGIDSDGVRECLGTLSEKEYISVKYQDETEVCLCPLPKGRLVFENRIDEEIDRSRNRRTYFLYSMFGAFAGGFIAAALALIVLLIAGV